MTHTEIGPEWVRPPRKPNPDDEQQGTGNDQGRPPSGGGGGGGGGKPRPGTNPPNEP